jgi:hypothetical protein
VPEHDEYNTEEQTALEFTGACRCVQTFVRKLAVLKSVITQALKARVLDFQHIFSQLAAAG